MLNKKVINIMENPSVDEIEIIAQKLTVGQTPNNPKIQTPSSNPAGQSVVQKKLIPRQNKLSLEKIDEMFKKMGQTIVMLFSENTKVRFIGCKNNMGRNYVVYVPDRYIITVKKGIKATGIKQIDLTPWKRQADFLGGINHDIFVINSGTIFAYYENQIFSFVKTLDEIVSFTKLDVMEQELETLISEKTVTEKPDITIAEEKGIDIVVDDVNNLILGCILPLLPISTIVSETKTAVLNQTVDKGFSVIEAHIDVFFKQKTDRITALLDSLKKIFTTRLGSLNDRYNSLTQERIKFIEFYEKILQNKEKINQVKADEYLKKVRENLDECSLLILKTRDDLDVFLTDYEYTLQDLVKESSY